jgi:hypothetical protein
VHKPIKKRYLVNLYLFNKIRNILSLHIYFFFVILSEEFNLFFLFWTFRFRPFYTGSSIPPGLTNPSPLVRGKAVLDKENPHWVLLPRLALPCLPYLPTSPLTSLTYPLTLTHLPHLPLPGFDLLAISYLALLYLLALPSLALPYLSSCLFRVTFFFFLNVF